MVVGGGGGGAGPAVPGMTPPYTHLFLHWARMRTLRVCEKAIQKRESRKESYEKGSHDGWCLVRRWQCCIEGRVNTHH